MIQKFNTIHILGGHKLSYDYSQKICAARDRNEISFNKLILIDADASCYAVGRVKNPDELVIKPYHEFILEYLSSHSQKEHSEPDTFVPDHTAPHVMLQVFMNLVQNAQLTPFAFQASLPFKKSLENGAIWALSYATWLCPADCAEPDICPHIKNTRDWDFNKSLPEFIDGLSHREKSKVAYIFSCAPLVAEISQIPVQQIKDSVQNFRELSNNNRSSLAVFVATHSHCHGILGKFTLT